jgi:ATP-dependent Clp protease ATP-binding subunit ClpC
MFDRFTERARRVVVHAQEEARMLNHIRIGTEHILLGLTDEGEGAAAEALESLGISLAALREQVEEIISPGQHAPSGHIPYAPGAKKALELSLREALQLGHNYVGTEHILLALIRERDGIAAQVLAKAGADGNRVRRCVIQLTQAAKDEEEPGPAPAAQRPGADGRTERDLLTEVLGRVESVDSRLSAMEQRVGTGPDLSDLDQRIAQARRDKEAAVATEDYENAAALRDTERQLLAARDARQQEWSAAQPDLRALAEGFRWLSDEVERLRGLLRQHDIEPQHRSEPPPGIEPKHRGEPRDGAA